ncbi:hypothetical protein [Shimia abyssi]|uniref:Uncharacterized protein n=1 Tax=Shimia abyssi TaxID=1662395 RepID=A0A2P8FHZ4_9RHOB|nr:hypothetical protein [Shimia abyssi]PSL21337.1 hypothetical protein CLV88_102457 [Shimia abyssi]
MQTRTFIAAILSTAMAITGFSASSAHALSEDDIAKILIGATALFIVGKAIDDHNNKDDYVARPTIPVKKPNPHRRQQVLPRNCKRDFVTARGKQIRGFGTRCLERERYSIRHLPQDCRRKVNTRRGVGTVYKVGCLRRSGYNVGGR